MKNLYTYSILLLGLLFYTGIPALQAQDYLIDFSAMGKTNTVDIVVVENLTQGTTLTLNGSDTLNLSETVGIKALQHHNDKLNIYPNPAAGHANIAFFNAEYGNVSIGVFNLSGQRSTGKNIVLQPGTHKFSISLPGRGIYLARVITPGNIYSGKIIAVASHVTGAGITYRGTGSRVFAPEKSENSGGIVPMQYNEGERLLFKGITGRYSAVLAVVPTQSRSIVFSFVECTDADSNHYAVLHLGTKAWMAENLKTTHYSDGSSVEYPGNDQREWTNNTNGAYAWYNNDSASHSGYGALYNWHAVNNTAGLCPPGWKVPGDADWNELIAFYDPFEDPNIWGSQSDFAGGMLKSTHTSPALHPRWDLPNTAAQNHDAFSAYPAGSRKHGGDYELLGQQVFWWTSSSDGVSDAWYRMIASQQADIYRYSVSKQAGMAVRCMAVINLPSITTAPASNILSTLALSGGNIINDGGDAVTARGIVWATWPNPSLEANEGAADGGQGTGSWVSELTGLTPGTIYYVRAYAVNSTGTAYATPQIFTSGADGDPCHGTPTMTDIDGNVYNTILFADQCWMKESLQTSHYRNGTPIENPGYSHEGWINNTTGAVTWYENNPYFKSIYGGLYNWYAVNNSNGLCPEGWHVPSEDEWLVLYDHLGGPHIGGKMKSTRTDPDPHPRWDQPNSGATNETGFTALPGGFRRDNNGIWGGIGQYSSHWTSTAQSSSSSRIVEFWHNSRLIYVSSGSKGFGRLVRCLRNE